MLEETAALREGIREYRLNLARVAQRLRGYRAAAEEKGWEGVVVLAVSAAAGVSSPQVGLAKSSGHEILDGQAIEMLTRAIQTAPLPQSLTGRQFSMTLDIRFSLND